MKFIGALIVAALLVIPADDLLVNTEAVFVWSAGGKLGVSVVGSPQGGKLTIFDAVGQPAFSITGSRIESSALERFVRKVVVEELAKLGTVTTPTPTPVVDELAKSSTVTMPTPTPTPVADELAKSSPVTMPTPTPTLAADESAKSSTVAMPTPTPAADESAKSNAVTMPTPTPAATSPQSSKTLPYTQDDLLAGGAYFSVTVESVRRVMDGYGQSRSAPTTVAVWEVLLAVRNTGPFDCLTAVLTGIAQQVTLGGDTYINYGDTTKLIVTRLKRHEVRRFVINVLGPDRPLSDWLEFSLSRKNFERWE